MPDSAKFPNPGLSSAAAAQRLARDGANVLPSKESRTVPRIVADVFREPMFLLLAACAAIYLVLGEHSDAWVLIAFVGVVLGITIVQERRTESALDALRDLSSPRAVVIRDGERVRIAGADVVAGDLLVLQEGDRVAADALVVESHALATDESLLTGESVPVRKCAGSLDATWSAPGGDDLPCVYAGSLVVSGRGLALVRATGPATELGRIGGSLASIEPGRTKLQADTDRLVRRVSVVAIGLCVVAAIVFGLTRGKWLEGALAGLATAMSLLPEEFPVVIAVFLAFGAWRLSRHRVLTRRIPAIEALGAATVLCVDKTGTLTENRMQVARLVDSRDREWRLDGEPVPGHDVPAAGQPRSLPEDFHSLLETAKLATPDDPFDPMERALVATVEEAIGGTGRNHRDWTLLREYPLGEGLMSMSRAWRRADRDGIAIAAKGAPEAIIELCHLDDRADAAASSAAPSAAAIRARIHALASSGYRVIAVAAARFDAGALPAHQHDFDFRYEGLVALADPIRPGVAQAIDECRGAGIRVVMITGDLPQTASAIASCIGIANGDDVLAGPAVAQLDDDRLADRIASTSVVARAVPGHKLRIVRALQARGHVVAMTGDGVNDAPALKAADIGLAMGRRGSDVAREAASLVVLDDDFSSIVRAVRMGRRIHANLSKAVSYIIAVHLPIAAVALVPIFFGWLAWPVVLLPAHIAFLELIIDPACSLAFEAEGEDPDLMQRPPRPADASLYSGLAVRFGFGEGLLVAAFALGAYAATLLSGFDEPTTRTTTFAALVLGNLALIVAGRSYRRASARPAAERNRVVGWIVAGALAALAAVLTVPALRELFRLAVPTWSAMGIAVASTAGTWMSLLALRRATDAGGRPAKA